MARRSPVLLLLLSFLMILPLSLSSTPTHVQQLPGFKGQLPFQMETGYLTVDEVNGVELIYYFFESERNASKDPLLLWLSGGPGCSSFSALFFEIGNNVKEQPFINLKGYIIGNPRTGEKIDVKSQVPFARGMGIISDEFAELVEKDCAGQDHENPKTVECAARLNTFKKYIHELSVANVLDPKCPSDNPRAPNSAGEYSKRSLKEDSFGRLFHPPETPELHCKSYAYYLGYFWANENVTREVLQIKKGTVSEWQRCNNFDYVKDIPSSLPYQFNLLKRGYRALVYSGDHDMMIPFVGTKLWIKSLNLTVVDPWRSWSVDNQVAGYIVLYSNDLTFATVRAAGHTAPEFKPQQCFAMFDRNLHRFWYQSQMAEGSIRVAPGEERSLEALWAEHSSMVQHT